MLSLFKWSCESKESKKVMHRQVQAVEPAPRWWIPCQPATQFWGNDGWTTVLIFATLGWNSLKLTIDWPLIDLDWSWLTLRFWLLRRMFQQYSGILSDRPSAHGQKAAHGIEAAVASPNVSNGSGKGVRMGSILIQFPVISSPKLLEDRDVIII